MEQIRVVAERIRAFLHRTAKRFLTSTFRACWSSPRTSRIRDETCLMQPPNNKLWMYGHRSLRSSFLSRARQRRIRINLMPAFIRSNICTKEADCLNQTQPLHALIRAHNSVEMTPSTRQRRRKKMRLIRRTHQKTATKRKKILRTQKILDKRNLSKMKRDRRRNWRTLRLRSGRPCNS